MASPVGELDNLSAAENRKPNNAISLAECDMPTIYNLDFEAYEELTPINSPMKHVFPKFVSPRKENYSNSPSQFFKSPVPKGMRNDPLEIRSIIRSKDSLLPPKTPPNRLNKNCFINRTPVNVPSAKKLSVKSPAELLQARIDSEPGCDSFLTFVHTLSPLVEMKNVDINSPLGIRLSPCPPSKYKEGSTMKKILPPFSSRQSNTLASMSQRSHIATPIRKNHAETIAVAQRLDFGLGSPRIEQASRLESPFPNIQTSTTPTPGKTQRSILGKRSYMLQIPKPGELYTNMDMKSINANLNKDYLTTPVSTVDVTTPSRIPPTHDSKRKRRIDRIAELEKSLSKGILNEKALTSRQPYTKKKIKTEKRAMTAKKTLYVDAINNPSNWKLLGSSLSNENIRSPVVSNKMQTIQSWTGRKEKSSVFIHPDPSPPQRKPCNCKKSGCLKLYCPCFQAGLYCTPDCNCCDCSNTCESESLRKEAKEAILERNPNAFKPKIQPSTCEKSKMLKPIHHTGCNCKKTGCLKKYCECFQAGVRCGDNCNCCDCKNFHGSELLALVLAGIPVTESPLISTNNINRTPNTCLPLSKENRKNDLKESQAQRKVKTVSNHKIKRKVETKLFHVAPLKEVKSILKKKEQSSLLKKSNCVNTVSTKEFYITSMGYDPCIPVIQLFGRRSIPMRKELGVEILSFLDNEDVYNSSLVNRMWSRVALDVSLWDYSGISL